MFERSAYNLIMQQNQSVSEALQTLEAKGYHLADLPEDQPDESIQSNDWRLDSVQKVQEEGKNSLLIAVQARVAALNWYL